MEAGMMIEPDIHFTDKDDEENTFLFDPEEDWDDEDEEWLTWDFLITKERFIQQLIGIIEGINSDGEINEVLSK